MSTEMNILFEILRADSKEEKEYIYIHIHKYTQYNKVKNSSNDEICISTFNITMNSREA